MKHRSDASDQNASAEATLAIRDVAGAINHHVAIDPIATVLARERIAVRAKHQGIEIFPAQGFTRRTIAGTGVAAEFVEPTVCARFEVRFTGPVHLLIGYEQGSRLSGETSLDGLPSSKLRDVARRFTFVPAGRVFHEWQEPRTLSKFICIYLDPVLLPLDAMLRNAARSLGPSMFFEDAVLWETALKLTKLVEESSASDRAYFEALGVVLMHEIIRLGQRSARAQPLVRGGLAAWQCRLISAYIEQHLAERFSIPTLAGLVRLSRFHFSRAFKQSFGVPPHRYQSDQRIERAKVLLADPDYSVTEIGFDLGFSETSSFSTAFRRATGMTPTTYHRSLTNLASKPATHVSIRAIADYALRQESSRGERRRGECCSERPLASS